LAKQLKYGDGVSARAESSRALERDWWRRTAGLFAHPRPVYEALRDELLTTAPARAEPMLAIVWLAGIAAVLASSVRVNPLDERNVDGIVFAVWAFLGGGAYGFVAYWLVGGAVYIGARGAGSLESYRLARHVLVFAAAPLALSLAIWPVRLAIYGGDLFHRGGSDSGLPNAVFAGIEGVFALWALALLVLGVRIVYGWDWRRSFAAVGLAAVVLGLFAAIPVVF
jgi:hypothetical protein